MFTGIIEEIGTVRRIQKTRTAAVLEIGASRIQSDMKIGDSIAVNGVCLTVTAFDSSCFQADVMHETLNRSSLASLKTGSHVNLERAMAAGGRFGGHIVAGHIDGTGRIIRTRRDDTAVWYTIQAPPAILRYAVEKGSIAIDGISLTVASLSPGAFSVSVIPHTARMTILGEKKRGDIVNLETDIVGKYVERLLGGPPGSDEGQRREGGYPPAAEASETEKPSGITRELLLRYGFE